MKMFVAYRRDDVPDFVEELHQFISGHHFDEDDSIFVDNNLPSGPPWRNGRDQQLEDSHVLLLVAGPDWERGKDQSHDLNDETDEIRRELLMAHQMNKVILPVLVGRDKFDKKALPECLRHILHNPQWAFLREKFDAQRAGAKLMVDLARTRETLRKKPIVFISSTLAFLEDQESTEGLDYFTSLVTATTQKLRNFGHEVILKVPRYERQESIEAPGSHQVELLREVEKNRRNYGGLLIAPFDTDAVCEVILRLCHKKDFPIATVDKGYDRDDLRFVSAGVIPPPAAVCDGLYNGGLAAKSIIRYLKDIGKLQATVVILQGLQGSVPRIQGFLKEISSHNTRCGQGNNVSTVVSKEIPFRQEPARKMALRYIKEEDWSALIDPILMDTIPQADRAKPGAIDAFFCCNDEMALGVRDALEECLMQERRPEPAVVVGFDGIGAVKRKILREKDPWLLNSVDVKLTTQVDHLVRAFDRAVTTRKQMEDELPVTRGALIDEGQTEHAKEMQKVRASPTGTRGTAECRSMNKAKRLATSHGGLDIGGLLCQRSGVGLLDFGQ